MKSVLAALIAGALAIAAAAQTTDPKAATESAAPSTTAQPAKDAAATAKASKEVSKVTTVERNSDIEEAKKAHKLMINRETKGSVGDDPRGYSAAEIRAKAGRSSSKVPPKATPENPTRAPQ